MYFHLTTVDFMQKAFQFCVPALKIPQPVMPYHPPTSLMSYSTVNLLLLISNLTNRLRLHQFLMSKTTEANKSLKTDANGAKKQPLTQL